MSDSDGENICTRFILCDLLFLFLLNFAYHVSLLQNKDCNNCADRGKVYEGEKVAFGGLVLNME